MRLNVPTEVKETERKNLIFDPSNNTQEICIHDYEKYNLLYGNHNYFSTLPAIIENFF